MFSMKLLYVREKFSSFEKFFAIIFFVLREAFLDESFCNKFFFFEEIRFAEIFLLIKIYFFDEIILFYFFNETTFYDFMFFSWKKLNFQYFFMKHFLMVFSFMFYFFL